MKKGLKSLIVGVLALLVGMIIIPFAVVIPMLKEDTTGSDSFLIPGAHQITVEDPGRLYLWSVYRTFHKGRTYNQSETLPDGLQFLLIDAEGNEVPFSTDFSTTSTFTTNNRTTAKKTIGYFDIPAPGTFMIAVTGDTEPRVFSYSNSLLPTKFSQIIIGSVCCFLFIIFGIGMTIVGIVKLTKNSRSSRRNPPPPLP